MSDGPPHQDDADRYWAERTEREARTARRQRRRERRLYAVGIAMVWAASVVFAFGVGYSQGHRVVTSTAIAFVWVEIGLLFGGMALMATNGRGGKVWIEDPEAAERWRLDVQREELRR